MLNIVLFGPPGAGKGTQSNLLIGHYHLIHLSTGDLLRNEISSGTELGMEAKKRMDQGLLVPDSVVIGMIKNKLASNPLASGFIFDGFPRTVTQAEALDTALASMNTSITGMIELIVDPEELEKRLLIRGKESMRPDDSSPEIIQKRIEEYLSKTTPVADFYRSQNKLKSITGIGEVHEIFSAIKHVIEHF